MGTIKRFNLNDLIDTYDIHTFIETGTHMGDGVDYALECKFNRIISLDIDSELVANAQLKYKNIPKVTILEGNSFDVLEKILPDITESCIFWLDAHFPGADLHKKAYNSEKNMDIRLPMEKEIRLIYNTRKGYNDVIICDDLRLYEDEHLIEDVDLNTHFQRCGINLKKEDVVSGINLDFIRNEMNDKFTLHKYYNDQGYAVLLPIL